MSQVVNSGQLMPNAFPPRYTESHRDVSEDGEDKTQDEKKGSMREVKAIGKAVGSPSGKVDKSKNDNGQLPKYPVAP